MGTGVRSLIKTLRDLFNLVQMTAEHIVHMQTALSEMHLNFTMY